MSIVKLLKSKSLLMLLLANFLGLPLAIGLPAPSDLHSLLGFLHVQSTHSQIT